MQPEQNPYDFILNTSEQPKPKLFNAGGSKKNKIILIAGLFSIIFIAFILISSFLGSADKNLQDKLLSIAQQQTEIIRVADLSKNEKTIRDQSTLIFAYNTSISLNTSSQQVTKILNKNKKVDQKQLALKKDTKTDELLKNAALNNTYDETFKDILKKQLTTYQTDLKDTYSDAKDPADKLVLKNAYDAATILLTN